MAAAHAVCGGSARADAHTMWHERASGGSGRNCAQLANDVQLARMAGVLGENVEADPLQGGRVLGESAADASRLSEAMDAAGQSRCRLFGEGESTARPGPEIRYESCPMPSWCPRSTWPMVSVSLSRHRCRNRGAAWSEEGPSALSALSWRVITLEAEDVAEVPMPGEARAAVDLWLAQRKGAAGLRRRQESRLAGLLTLSRRESRFYRRLYQGLPADDVDIRDLPPVTKPELMAAFDDWVTDPGVTREGVEAFVADPALLGVPYLGQYFVCTSSGTSGHPGLFVYDRGAINVLRAMMIARIDLGWLTTGELIHLARRGNRWAAVVGTGSHFAGAGWIEMERRRSRWRSRAFRLFSVQRPLAELAAALQEFDPAILTGYPSALRLLAEEQSVGRLHLRPLLVETAGESTSTDASASMAGVFGCSVHDVYAASECQWLAFGCAAGWLHVNSDWTVLEPVDEDFRPTPQGEPSYTVLLTNLANRVQPIIRYDLSDSVVAKPSPCPCGNPLPAIRVVGRCDDVLHLIGSDGSAVNILPLAIASVVEETPAVHRSQLIQTGPAAIRLRMESRPGADVERMWLDVTTNLHRYLVAQNLGNVSVVRASEPPEQSATSGKFRQVIA